MKWVCSCELIHIHLGHIAEGQEIKYRQFIQEMSIFSVRGGLKGMSMNWLLRDRSFRSTAVLYRTSGTLLFIAPTKQGHSPSLSRSITSSKESARLRVKPTQASTPKRSASGQASHQQWLALADKTNCWCRHWLPSFWQWLSSY